MESIIKHLMEIQDIVTTISEYFYLRFKELTSADSARVYIRMLAKSLYVKPQITIVKVLAPSEEMSGIVSPEVPVEQFPFGRSFGVNMTTSLNSSMRTVIAPVVAGVDE